MPTKEKCYAIQGSRKMFTQLTVPAQVGYSGVQVTGMIEWSQKSRPKKIPGPQINPPKIPCSSEPHISNPQVTSERNQKFTKAKGNSSDGKAN